MISSMILKYISSLMVGTGEYAPIPPVLGPLSLSNTLLWSLDKGIGIISLPSVKTRKDTSSPVKHSSIIIILPASP